MKALKRLLLAGGAAMLLSAAAVVATSGTASAEPPTGYNAYAYSEENYGGAQYTIYGPLYARSQNQWYQAPVDIRSFINHTPWNFLGKSKDGQVTYTFNHTSTGGYHYIGSPFGSGNQALRSLAANL